MRDQILIMGSDQMIQHRGFRPSGGADALREIPVTTLHESFRDKTGAGSHNITELKGGFVIPPEVWREQKQIHPKIQLMRQAPCGDFANVVEAGHPDKRCNPAARAAFAISGRISMARLIDDEETAYRDVRIDRSFCNRGTCRKRLAPSHTTRLDCRSWPPRIATTRRRFRAIRYLAPRASPLAGQSSLGATSTLRTRAPLGSDSASLGLRSLCRRRDGHRLGRKLASRDTCSRSAPEATSSARGGSSSAGVRTQGPSEWRAAAPHTAPSRRPLSHAAINLSSRRRRVSSCLA